MDRRVARDAPVIERSLIPYSKCIRHRTRARARARREEDSPVHRGDAPLRRHTRLIRREPPQREQQHGGSRPLPHPRHSSSPSSTRPDGFHDRFANSPESPSALKLLLTPRLQPPLQRTPAPLSTPQDSRIHRFRWGEGVSRRTSRRSAVIEPLLGVPFCSRLIIDGG